MNKYSIENCEEFLHSKEFTRILWKIFRMNERYGTYIYEIGLRKAKAIRMEKVLQRELSVKGVDRKKVKV